MSDNPHYTFNFTELHGALDPPGTLTTDQLIAIFGSNRNVELFGTLGNYGQRIKELVDGAIKAGSLDVIVPGRGPDHTYRWWISFFAQGVNIARWDLVDSGELYAEVKQ